MNTTNNTVLITGGSAGIGLAIAKLLNERGNKVIITGRNAERLNKALSALPGATGIVSDVSNEQDIQHLAARMQAEFPALNMLVNNAGKAYAYKLGTGASAADKAKDEMQTNYLSVISLTEQLLSLLGRQKEAAIVNVSSIVAFVPGSSIPTYAASKAALHSYTQSLRFSLRDTSVKVFEVMPPLVNTDFSQDIGGSNGIAPSVVADDLLAAFEADRTEIHVGDTAAIYELSRRSPADAFNAMNPVV